MKPNYVAEEAVNKTEELINLYQTKKKLRSTFRNKSIDGEIQTAHQRLLRQFVEIDQGKQLSVGPANYKEGKSLVSPVEELHSLHYVTKQREYDRIDNDNEKFLNKLTTTQSSVHSYIELLDHFAKTKKISIMIGKREKDDVDQIYRKRDSYLVK